MRNNYLVKLVKYIKKVYGIEERLNELTDGRVNPTYKTGRVMQVLLLGFLLRIQSLNELNCMLKEREFNNIFPKGTKLPLVDTIRDTIKTISVKGIREILKSINKKAIRNKTYDKGTIDGYVVAAIDGTKLFGSYDKCCSLCLTTVIKGKNYYYHSGVVMTLIGEGVKLVLDYEMYNPKIDSSKKDEGELNAAKRLLVRATSEYKRFVDIVVYDALAANSVWINHCRKCEIDVIVRVKNNYNNSLKEIKRLTNKKEVAEVWVKGQDKIEVYESLFNLKGVEQKLRYVKYAITNTNRKRNQILIITSCLELSLKTIYKMIKARWNIENCIFNNLKTEAGLEHCFVHNGNAIETIVGMIFIASNLFQLFKLRRIKNKVRIQKELIRLLLKGLYLLEYDKELVFDTG